MLKKQGVKMLVQLAISLLNDYLLVLEQKEPLTNDERAHTNNVGTYPTTTQQVH